LKDQIDAFHQQFPSAEVDILANLRASFSGIQIENWTHFLILIDALDFWFSLMSKDGMFVS